MLQNILNLDGVMLLNKKTQKMITGRSGTCHALVDGEIFSNLSRYTAERAGMAKPGNRWCCDSCSSASWLPQK